MDIRDPRGLKAKAGEALRAAAYDPRKLILLYTGASTILALALLGIDQLLQHLLSQTGGLSGLGTRSLLSTVQTVLGNCRIFLIPFWNMGYIFTTLAIARRQPVGPGTLLAGFRNFGPVLRFYLLQVLVYTGVGFVCVYLSSGIFLLTPLSRPLVESMMANSSALTDTADLAALLEDPAIARATAPLYLIFLAVFLLASAPVFYRLRLGEYALAAQPQAGALAALRSSFLTTKGNWPWLLRLDLSYWWYYGLTLLTMALTNGDLILALVGVELPLSEEVSYLLFAALGLCATAVVDYLARNRYAVTFALAYDALTPDPLPTAPTPTSRELPGAPWA